jgi:hypothetical protein
LKFSEVGTTESTIQQCFGKALLSHNKKDIGESKVPVVWSAPLTVDRLQVRN